VSTEQSPFRTAAGALHSDRARAESFGGIAEQYDRYRPSYPDQLIADLLALNPEWTLDVACGTGKVAVPLLACGLAVLGVEIDEQMAEVARRHGIIVELGAFETWDDQGRTFDLITCGQGWHWIDPEIGPQKAARLLNPGGTLALFWNYAGAAGEVKKALQAVYDERAPQLNRDMRSQKHEDDKFLDALKATKLFASVRAEDYAWTTTLSADEWVARLATHSDHITLPDDERGPLLDAVHAAIEEHGGSVELRGGTYTIFARTAEK
jgi:SAM-dependent methyltransferase